jgi:uncharacterized protein YgbK (DUF1537 family)
MLTILADDLTGACDAGAPCAGRAAVPVTVFPDVRANGTVAVVDTESRGLPAADAACRVRAAASGAAGTTVWFKKVDSTMRGPIAAELDALLRETGAPAAVLCPAFPAQGRTVVDGVLRIDGTPVGDTALARDPDFRMGSSDIAAGLQRDTTRPLVAWRLGALRAGGVAGAGCPAGGIAIADAVTDEDLDRVVTAVLGATPSPLLAGAAGLAGALARRLGLGGVPPGIPAGARWLIVAGSTHPATCAQVAAVRDGAHVVTASGEVSSDRSAVARELAVRARWVVDDRAVDVVAVTGGDTAVALFRELGGERIDLLGAPEPGLALGWLRARGRAPLLLLTKAGGFGAPDLFQKLVQSAQGARATT